jgi:hypothetical protein
MTQPQPPQIGTIGVVSTSGIVGRAIRIVTGTEDQYAKWGDSKANHAVVYVGPVLPTTAKPQLMQANPIGGYSFADWNTYGDRMVWLNRIGQMQVDGSLVELNPTFAERTQIVSRSLSIRGDKYGFLDLLAIAFAQKRLRHWDPDYLKDTQHYLAHPPWWVNQIQKQNRFICSQAADYTWENVVSSTGEKGLFADGRIAGLVSPADLLSLRIA